MSVTACGIFDCSGCEHTPSKCPGCAEGNEILAKRGSSTCGIYRCIQEQNLSNCSECSKTTCGFYRETDLICPLRGQFENKRWWASRLARSITQHNKLVTNKDSQKISERTVGRLRWYLMALDMFAAQDITSVSSWQLAQRVGVNAALIRKDLSRFGEFGTPSFGYDVQYLRRKIMDILGLNELKHVIWLGSQRLNDHLSMLPRLAEHNCRIVAVIDRDPNEIGRKVADVQVMSLESLPQLLTNLSVDTAVIALPGSEAQKAATMLVNGGVKAILNLSPTLVIVPDHVKLRNVDVASELLELSYYCTEMNRKKDEEKN